MFNKLIFAYLVPGLIFTSILDSKPIKVVGLVPVRNEERFITNCLQTLALYTDAIVVLDDASTDNTLAIVESLKIDCKIERIIRNSQPWIKNESRDRSALLKAGREINGTHFVVVDADEMFSAQCLEGNFLRKKIEALKPGESISMLLIHPWKNLHFYTTKLIVPLRCIFCDQPNAYFPAMFNQLPRVPKGIDGKVYEITDMDHVAIHLIFINWRNFVIKRLWYMCLELVHSKNPNKVAASHEINKLYNSTIFTAEHFDNYINCSKQSWFNYPFFNKFITYEDEEWRKAQILAWFRQYGKDYFKHLAIWELNIEEM